jgi:hypothetical protein
MAILISYQIALILGVAVAVLIFSWYIRRRRAGTYVSLNLRKRTYFVVDPNGCWGGNWPPEIALRVEQDPVTEQWVTSLYLASVRIWTTVTPTATGGRRKIKPFVDALREISELKRPEKTNQFDVMIEMLTV